MRRQLQLASSFLFANYIGSCNSRQKVYSRGPRLLLLIAMLVSVPRLCYAQGSPSSITLTPSTTVSGPVTSILAGQWFHQRGDGSANVAVNYDFIGNTYQDAPALRVHGKPFSVAFWYRSTQDRQFAVIWENGEVGGTTGYVVGFNNGFISVSENNGSAGCPSWSNASKTTKDGQWHHAAIVADPNASATYIYLDGSLDKKVGYCDPADTSNGTNHYYGIGRNDPQYDFARRYRPFHRMGGKFRVLSKLSPLRSVEPGRRDLPHARRDTAI